MQLFLVISVCMSTARVTVCSFQVLCFLMIFAWATLSKIKLMMPISDGESKIFEAYRPLACMSDSLFLHCIRPSLSEPHF